MSNIAEEFKKGLESEFLKLIRIGTYESGYYNLNNGEEFEFLGENQPYSLTGTYKIRKNYLLPNKETGLEVTTTKSLDSDYFSEMISVTKSKEGFLYFVTQSIGTGKASVNISMSTIQEEGSSYGINFMINNDSTLAISIRNRQILIKLVDVGNEKKPVIISQTEIDGKYVPVQEDLSNDKYRDVLNGLLSKIENEEIRKIFLEDEFFEFLYNIPKRFFKWKALDLPRANNNMIATINKVRDDALAEFSDGGYPGYYRTVLVKELDTAISVRNSDMNMALSTLRSLENALYPMTKNNENTL